MPEMRDVRVDRRSLLRAGAVAGAGLFSLGGTATAAERGRTESSVEPTADFDFGPNPVVAGRPVTFAVTDPSAASECAWAFGDRATATGERTSYSFPEGGRETVSLTVTSETGRTDTVRAELTVYREVAAEIDDSDRDDRLLAVVVRGEADFDPTAEISTDTLRLGSPTALAMGGGATPVRTGSRGDDLRAWFPASAVDADAETRLGGRTTDDVALLGLAD